MKTSEIEKTKDNLNAYYIIAFDSGAHGTRYIGEYDNETTGEREYAKAFDTKNEAENYMTEHEYVGWVECIEIENEANS